MDRVKGSQGGLGERSGGGKQGAIERPQRDRVEQDARAFDKQVARKLGVMGGRGEPRADLGQDQLAGDDVPVGEEGAQRLRLRLSRMSFTSAEASA